jgi:cytoskeleton protein RodZ
MQTIGERLEEARKKKGVSIREAAEATKIRGEYLQSFEGNKFDLDLSEIYLRGFLRSYATFLKLAPDRILGDYEALGHGDAKPRQPSREVYGRMDLSISAAEDREERSSAPAGEMERAEVGRGPHQPRNHSHLPKTPAIDPALVYKGAIVVGIVVALLLVVGALKYLLGGPAPSESSRVAAPPAVVAAPEAAATMSIVARAPVRIKVVRQSDGAELFQGPLATGDHQDFPNVALFVTCTAFESIQLEYKGSFYDFTDAARAKITGYHREPVPAFSN